MNKLELLKQLNFGARVAEEEINELAGYFVETDQWERISRGDIDVIRGDKGAGKSAIYSLLNARTDNFFDKNILLVSAEKPRGATVFASLSTSPPTSENDFISLWKLYIASLVGHKIKEFSIYGENAKKLISILVDQELLENNGFDLGRMFRNVLAYARRWKNAGIEPSVSVDAATNIATYGIKICPGNESMDKSSVSVDELLIIANRALEENNFKVWVLLDRLDVAFSENVSLEINALRALFRVYRDISDLDHIKLKIFIRTDIWKNITEGGFREATHITKFVVLEWAHSALLNLMIRRIISNDALLRADNINKEGVLNNFESQKSLFDRLFPSQVDQGSRKPSTLDWMISRCADGTNKTAPRELIHLLTSLRDTEISRMERGENAAPDEQLFDRSVFKAALPTVSESRLVQNLYAEHPDLKKYIGLLNEGKTEQTVDSLATIWKTDHSHASEVANRLVDIGFFQRRGARESETYWVPFLYRDALHMIQGLADEG